MYKDYTQESPNFQELLEIENLELSKFDKHIFCTKYELTFEKMLKLFKILMYKISLQNQKVEVRLDDFEKEVENKMDD